MSLGRPEGILDNTHLRHEGAVLYAGLVAKGLYELDGIYRELLLEDAHAQGRPPQHRRLSDQY